LVAFPQFYDSTDVTLQTAAIAVSQNSGTTYGPVTFHLWNDKGGSLGATTLKNLRIRPTVSNGVSRVSSGFPIVDESWIQIQVSGLNSVGDSTMEAQTTGFVPIGANNPLVLKDVPKNCARFLDVKIVVPAGAQNLSQEVYLELIYDESTVVLPLKMGLIFGAGILPDFRDTTARRLRSGFELSAAGTDIVTIANGRLAWDGKPFCKLQTTVSLNQTAADGALTAGQSYIARISGAMNGAITSFSINTTKSNRSASPTAPAVPAGEINLGLVTVNYQAGGTSIINSGNLDVSGVLRGEYLLTIGSGLNLNIGAGMAICSTDQQPFNGAIATLTLSDNNSPGENIWLLPDGTFTKNTGVPASPPVPGAIQLGNAVTSGGAITGLLTQRQFVDTAITEYVMRLVYKGSLAAIVTAPDWDVLPFAAWLDAVDFEIGAVGAGASSGNFKVNVWRAAAGSDPSGGGSTIYTSFGTNDQRPSIAYNASSARSAGNNLHEDNGGAGGFVAGTRFGFDLSVIPSGTFTTDPQDIIVLLHFRKK